MLVRDLVTNITRDYFKSPIKISIGLSIIETFLFTLIIFLNSLLNLHYKQTFNYQDFIKNAIGQFSEFVISILTTWYVVFTYFMLKTAIDLRNKKIDPILIVSKSKDTKSSDYKLEQLYYFNDKIKDIFGIWNEPEFDEKYANINIKNVNNIEAREIEIQLKLEVSNKNIKKIEPLFESKKIPLIEKNSDIDLSISCISNVPEKFNISVEIQSLKYKGIYSESIIPYHGNKLFEYQGGLQSPKPMIKEIKGD